MDKRTYKRRTILGLTAGLATTGLASVAGAKTPEDPRSISYGQTIQGEIDLGDPRDPEYDDLAEPIQFTASSGDSVSITQETSSFDAFLLLVDPDGYYVASNDDGFSTNTNSQIEATLQYSGTYTIWAGSLSGDSTGTYTLSLEQTGSGDTGSGGSSGTGADLRSISYGETVQGEIDSGDATDPVYNGRSEPVEFTAESGDQVRITQQSDEFDTYLVLTDPYGNTVGRNDDGVGMGLNSELTTTLEQSGTYTIWAGSYSGTAMGSYTLSLEQGENVSGVPEDTHVMSYGDSFEAEISTNSPRDPSFGDLAEPVQFEASEGDRVRITQRASTFDAFLLLTDPNGGVVTSNDDGPNMGTNAQITMTLAMSGTYTIWAGSLSGSSTGTFSLELVNAESADTGADLRSISYGETLDGEIDFADPTDPVYDEPAEPVQFEGTEGDSLRIIQESTEIDTYLTLIGPTGQTIAESDDTATSTNSEMQVTLESSGTYTIWAGAYSVNGMGQYSLTVDALSTATQTASGTEDAADSPDDNDDPDANGDDSSGGSVPGFGALTTIGAVGAGALFRQFRSDDD